MPLRVSWDASRGPLGFSGASWRPLGGSWGRVGGLWGALRGMLGIFRGHGGKGSQGPFEVPPLEAVVGRLRCLLGRLGALFSSLRLSWVLLGPSWGDRGASGVVFGCRKPEKSRTLKSTKQARQICKFDSRGNLACRLGALLGALGPA